MLQISFFGKEIPVIMPKKKDKFYICILLITNRYNTLKSHKKDAHTGLIILILKRQENSLGCHDLFIFRVTLGRYFCLVIKFAIFFRCFLPCFLYPSCFLIFPTQESCFFALNRLFMECWQHLTNISSSAQISLCTGLQIYILFFLSVLFIHLEFA